MIQPFVDAFIAARETLAADLQTNQPGSYKDLVTRLISNLQGTQDTVDGWRKESPDPDRITVIDHGHYQGTQLFIIGAQGYQPSVYWSIFVDYGSCSGCDTFEATRGYRYDDKEPMPQKELDGYLTMMLHMVQGMRRIGGNDVEV